MKYKIWNKQEKLITPSGKVFTPQEVFEQYPASEIIDYIIHDGSINMSVFIPYESYKENLIEAGMVVEKNDTTKQILDKISLFEKQRGNNFLPSVEERTVAALEFQNLLNMEDEVE